MATQALTMRDKAAARWEAATRARVVEQQALFCQERARATLPAGAGRIECGRGYDLAKQWATMPGTTAVDADVAQACARKLTSG